MSNGKNVRVGHNYEREVKQLFVDAGWGCTRAARSASAMDLIAWVKNYTPHDAAFIVFNKEGYTTKVSKSEVIPLRFLASRIEKKYFKHIHWQVVVDEEWIICLMQCKIGKR